MPLIDVTASSERIQSIRQQIGQVWAAIQAGNFYPAPSPMNCSTCPYRSRCPAFA